MTLSELFESWSDTWVSLQQKRFKPTVEKIIREKLKLDDNFQIVWDDSYFKENSEE